MGQPNLASQCEFFDANGKGCTNQWYSWSADHQGLLYCRYHYLLWLKENKPRGYINSVLDSLSEDQLLAMVAAMGRSGK